MVEEYLHVKGNKSSFSFLKNLSCLFNVQLELLNVWLRKKYRVQKSRQGQKDTIIWTINMDELITIGLNEIT